MNTKGSREEFVFPELAPPVSHYAHAVRYQNHLYVSGLVGLDRDLKVVSEDAAEQTDKILEDLTFVLGRFNADLSRVLRVTVYLTDIADRTRINPVREKHFGQTRPASTLIEISALVMPELKVEIEAIAGL